MEEWSRYDMIKMIVTIGSLGVCHHLVLIRMRFENDIRNGSSRGSWRMIWLGFAVDMRYIDGHRALVPDMRFATST